MVLSRRRKAVLALAALAAISVLALYPFGRNYLARSRELARLRELHIAADRQEFESQAPQDGPNSATDIQAAIFALGSSSLSAEDLSILLTFGKAGGKVSLIKFEGSEIVPLPRVRSTIDRLRPVFTQLAGGKGKARCTFSREGGILKPESQWAKPAVQVLNLLGARIGDSLSRNDKSQAIADLELLGDLTNQVETSSLGLVQVASLSACAMEVASRWPSDEHVVSIAKEVLRQNSNQDLAAVRFNLAVIESRELLWSADPSVDLLARSDSFSWAYRSKLNRLMAEEKILGLWRELAESQQGLHSDKATALLIQLDEDESFSGELASQVMHAMQERERPVDEVGLREFFLLLLGDPKRLATQAWSGSGGVSVIMDAEPFVAAPKTR